MPRAWRAWLVLTCISILALYLGHRFGGRQGVLWAVAFALLLNAFFYFYADFFLKPLFKGQKLEGQDPWHLSANLTKLCQISRTRRPQLCILPKLSPQAFALGRSPNSGCIYLTEGLLRRLTEEEVEAILAFELALIKRLDTFSMSIASAFVAGLLTVTRTLDWAFRWLLGTKSKPHSRYNHIFTNLVSPLFGLMIRSTISEQDYYEADQLAASWIKEPRALAQALWKLQSFRQTQPWAAPVSTSHLFVVNPLTRRGWTRYLHVQPSVETRIRRLVGHYPL